MSTATLVHQNYLRTHRILNPMERSALYPDQYSDPEYSYQNDQGMIVPIIYWTGLFVIMVLVCFYSARNYCSQRRSQVSPSSSDNNESSNKLPDEERRKRILTVFEKSEATMEVSKGAILLENPKAAAAEPDEEMGMVSVSLRMTSMLQLTTKKNNKTNNNKNRKYSTVPNCCAICLEDYKVGDVVVWSCGSSSGSSSSSSSQEGRCPHVYHRDCVVDYLVKKGDEKGYPCPSCRREYIDSASIEAIEVSETDASESNSNES